MSPGMISKDGNKGTVVIKQMVSQTQKPACLSHLLTDASLPGIVWDPRGGYYIRQTGSQAAQVKPDVDWVYLVNLCHIKWISLCMLEAWSFECCRWRHHSPCCNRKWAFERGQLFKDYICSQSDRQNAVQKGLKYQDQGNSSHQRVDFQIIRVADCSWSLGPNFQSMQYSHRE